jgi:hypothetical protein
MTYSDTISWSKTETHTTDWSGTLSLTITGSSEVDVVVSKETATVEVSGSVTNGESSS